MKVPFGSDKGLRAIAVLLAALLLAEGVFALHAAWFENRYSSFRSEKLEESLAGAQAMFSELEAETSRLAAAMSAKIVEERLLDEPDPFARIDLFRLLADAGASPVVSGLLVRDTSGRPVAWSGKSFELDVPLEPTRCSGIFRSRMYRVLYSIAPILHDETEARPRGSVVAISVFDSNFPLHNRFLRGVDFMDVAIERFGLRDVDISRREGAMRSAQGDPHMKGGTLRNADGEMIGHVNVEVFSLNAYLARFGRARDQVRGVLLTLLLVLITLLTAATALREGATPVLTGVFALVALGARTAIFHAGFPGILTEGSVFDPAHFSMITELLGLDLGWLHSPGDLLITGVFLVSVAGVALAVLGRRFSLRPGSRRSPAVGAALLVAGLAAAVFLVTVWLALLHSLIFYSTIEFFSADAVLPSLPEASILLGLFLITISLMLGFAALLTGGLRLLAGESVRLRAALYAALALALCAGIRQFTDMSAMLAGLAAMTAVAGTAVLAGWSRFGSMLRLSVLTALATLFAFPPMIREVWREIRADVEEEAELLFRPTGLRSPEHRLATDLAEISQDEWLVSHFERGPDEVPQDAAFRIWARGPLSRRPRGCDIAVLDETGTRTLSRFEIDMPLLSWLPDPLPGTASRELTVWPPQPGKGEAAHLLFLVGTAPVFGEDGGFLGQVIVRMPSTRPSLDTAPRPEILRPYESASLSGSTRDLFYSEYEDDLLVTSSNPEYPKLHRADPAVKDALFTKEEPQFWFREWIADAWWMNLYRPIRADGRNVGIMSVGFRSRETRSLIVSFLSMLLVNSLGALAGSFLFVLVGFRRFVLKFQHKLLLSYLVVSAIPVTLLAQVNHSIAQETVDEQMRDSLKRTMRQVKAELADRQIIERLSRVTDARPGEITDEDMKDLGHRVGQDVNLFLVDEERSVGAALLASSEPGIFATELFSNQLSGDAYLGTVLRGREFHAARESVGEYSFLVGYAPLMDADGKVLGVLSLPLIYGQDAVDKELARRNSLILALYFLILIVVVFIGMLLARRISSPIERLAEGTRRLSAGDFDYRIPGHSRDEFGYLTRSFNRMTKDLRESREKVVKAEKDAAWREMAKQIAHEIKNPLTPMRLSAQQILRAWKDRHEEFDQILSQGMGTIIRQSETLSRIASEFSAFARLPAIHLRRVDPAALVHEVAGLYRASEDIRLVEEFEAVPHVLADPDEFRRVIVNLATNAIQAMERGGGVLTLRVRSVAGAGVREPLVEISVKDTGVGIPPEDMGRLFEPNFSTKTGGTGLGLAISRAVVDKLGGSIAVESEPGRGTTFTVHLPPAPPPGPPSPPEEE